MFIPWFLAMLGNIPNMVTHISLLKKIKDEVELFAFFLHYTHISYSSTRGLMNI